MHVLMDLISATYPQLSCCHHCCSSGRYPKHSFQYLRMNTLNKFKVQELTSQTTIQIHLEGTSWFLPAIWGKSVSMNICMCSAESSNWFHKLIWLVFNVISTALKCRFKGSADILSLKLFTLSMVKNSAVIQYIQL